MHMADGYEILILIVTVIQNFVTLVTFVACDHLATVCIVMETTQCQVDYALLGIAGQHVIAGFE